MCLAWVRHRRWHAYQIYVKIFCITKFHRATAVSHAMLKHILKTAIHVRNSETILSALYIETSMQSTNTNTRYTRAHVADSDFQMKSLDLFDIKLKYKICFHENHLAFVIAECVVLCAPLSVLVWLVQQRFFILYQSLVQPVGPLLPCANFSCWLLFILITNQQVKTWFRTEKGLWPIESKISYHDHDVATSIQRGVMACRILATLLPYLVFANQPKRPHSRGRQVSTPNLIYRST